jgi:hypothetical protein
MPTAVWHDLGPVDGACTVCGAQGLLSLGEARFTRSVTERVRREHVPTPARFVSCTDCGWRWSVRTTDRAADGAQRRAATPDPQAVRADDERVATRTVLPEPRRSGLAGRDWAYPRA